jgi:hypothetical protein
MPRSTPSSSVEAAPVVRWTEAGENRSARWRSESGAPPPARVVIADDRMTADEAYGLACQGTALLWRGDFQNARQMLVALRTRAYRNPRRRKKPEAPAAPAEAFHLHRQAQSQRARTLGMLLVPLDKDYGIPLRRAPDIRPACTEAWGPGREASVASLREILGLIGAHEWRREGIEVPCPKRRPRTASPSTSAPARACWPRCSRGAASRR